MVFFPFFLLFCLSANRLDNNDGITPISRLKAELAAKGWKADFSDDTEKIFWEASGKKPGEITWRVISQHSIGPDSRQPLRCVLRIPSCKQYTFFAENGKEKVIRGYLPTNREKATEISKKTVVATDRTHLKLAVFVQKVVVLADGGEPIYSDEVSVRFFVKKTK